MRGNHFQCNVTHRHQRTCSGMYWGRMWVMEVPHLAEKWWILRLWLTSVSCTEGEKISEMLGICGKNWRKVDFVKNLGVKNQCPCAIKAWLYDCCWKIDHKRDFDMWVRMQAKGFPVYSQFHFFAFIPHGYIRMQRHASWVRSQIYSQTFYTISGSCLWLLFLSVHNVHTLERYQTATMCFEAEI